MISHHRASCSRIYHPTHDLQRATNLGASVNKVAHEDKLPGSVAIDSIALFVSQPSQQPLKLGSVAMTRLGNSVASARHVRISHPRRIRPSFLGAKFVIAIL